MLCEPGAQFHHLRLHAHDAAVVRPQGCKWLNYEGEIAIVIGRECRNVPQDEAAAYIAGYTIANDFGLHDFRDTDAGSMLRVKGSDTLGPLGPGLVDDWDFRGKRIRTLVNGEVKQDGSTDEMVWDMHELVADIARTITLVPGDVILSGTPAHSRPVQPGDVVEVEVEGLGRLTNTIVEGGVPVRDDVGAQPSESEEVVSTALGRNVWAAPRNVFIVRCASGVTRMRQRPVGTSASRGGVANSTPSALMSWANTSPSWSSATWPTKPARPPSAAIPAAVFAADPPLVSRAGPICA